MNNIDIRNYIINNLKDDNINEIKKSIVDSIESRDEDTLIGLGVLFEFVWTSSNEKEQNKILEYIKKSITK